MATKSKARCDWARSGKVWQARFGEARQYKLVSQIVIAKPSNAYR